jgi:hypothetical protein
MEKSLRVFVCSTYRDLVSERNALLDGLEWLRTQYPSVTYFCPRSIQPFDLCKEEIKASDVMVLILGHVHGVLAPGQDAPHGEAEYREGIALGKKILVYFRAEKVGIFPVHFERDTQRASQLKAFKAKLDADHGAKTFTDAQSLVHLVNLDLAELAQERGLEPKPGSKSSRQRTNETRRVPMIGVLAAVEPPPAEPYTGVTRTIPIMQKALATPFRRRARSSSKTGKALITVAVLLVAAGFVLARFHKMPMRPMPLSGKSAAGRAENPQAPRAREEASPQDPAESEDEAAPEALAPAPAPKPDRGAVVMMEDPDTVKTFLLKALDGTAQEQFRAGEMYEKGEGVRRNDSLSFRFYRKAAEQGMAEAQYKTAGLYRWGKGTVKSAYQAARWYQAAAEQGHSKSQVRLGQLYRTGKGVPRDEMQAFKWFLKAADQKDPEAEKILADLKQN